MLREWPLLVQSSWDVARIGCRCCRCCGNGIGMCSSLLKLPFLPAAWQAHLSTQVAIVCGVAALCHGAQAAEQDVDIGLSVSPSVTGVNTQFNATVAM